jgi:hypothetical protein
MTQPVDLSQTFCDFCSAPVCRTVYLVPAFRVEFPASDSQVGSVTAEAGAWGACAFCGPIIERNDLEALVQRAITQGLIRGGSLRGTVEQVQHRMRLHFGAILQLKQGPFDPDDLPELRGRPDKAVGVTLLRAEDGSLRVAPIMPPPPHPLRP